MPLKVLMFGWEFPPHNSGGLGTACLGICRAMLRTDVDLTFVLPRKMSIESGSIKIKFAGLEKIKFTAVNSTLYPYVTSNSYQNITGIENSIYGSSLLQEVLAYGQRAKVIAMKEDFDIIHAHDWLSFPAGIEAKKVSGKPLVVHVHATEFDRSGGGGVNQSVYEIEKRGMEEADGIIAISHWTKNIIMKNYGISEEKIRVVHNGIETDGFSNLGGYLNNLKKSGKKMILFVGRITLQKGPDYFIETARRVLEMRPNVFFVVAGSGDMEQQMISRVAELGLSDKIIFAGFMRGGELNALYQAADLYVLPSVSEPFGLTPLESLVNKTPVLVSRQSGVSEVLTNALKADFWDIDDMSDKIISLVDNPALYQTLKENGHKEVQNITWHKSVAGYIDFYKNLLAKIIKR